MLHTNRTIAGLIAIIALALLTVPAGATVTVQNTRADWEALTTGFFETLVDFNGLAPAYSPYSTDYSTAAGLTINEVTFVGFTGEAGVYGMRVRNPAGSPGNWNSGDYLDVGYAPGYLLATRPLGITAVGVDLMSNSPGKAVTVTLSTGESYSVPTYALPTRAFIGFVTDTPIASIRFSVSSGYAEIDNFSYATSTPEPDALVLAGAGLIGLIIARRLRRRCR